MSWFEGLIGKALEAAIDLRRGITRISDLSIRETEEKARLLKQADKAMDLVKLGADLLVSTGLAAQSDQERLLGDLLYRYQLAVMAAEEMRRVRFSKSARTEAQEEVKALRAEADRLLKGRHPFDWSLEFPEVFVEASVWDDPKGFDAMVGNPPFVGGQRITGALGTDYRDYLVNCIGNGRRGSADLCAYFFLRARDLLRDGGCFGLLATNTIAQGDTREVGLDQLVADGCTIMQAVPSRKWPGTASLEVAHVWVRRGQWRGTYTLDDKPVQGITPFLTPTGAVQGKPYRLAANAGKSFQGSIILGMGFVLTPEEAHALIAKDPRNRDVLFPYLNGEDLNSRPDQSPSRWVINFHDWPLERAETYPDCMRIVREKVKPEREKNNRKVRRERWWQFAERAPELYATIAGMERVLVRARVANINSIAFVPANIVCSEQIVVFVSESCGFFAVLQSAPHTQWLTHHASSMRTDVRYTPSDCFDTFPFPEVTHGLDIVGERYYTHRQSIMLARQQGLTKTYNRFHDPDETDADIVPLRELHVEMDQAVAAAYGWDDLDLGHSFHQTKQGLRFTISEPARREVLGRLLALNHVRYEEEERLGLHEKKGKATDRKGRKAGSAKALSLFGVTAGG